MPRDPGSVNVAVANPDDISIAYESSSSSSTSAIAAAINSSGDICGGAAGGGGADPATGPADAGARSGSNDARLSLSIFFTLLAPCVMISFCNATAAALPVGSGGGAPDSSSSSESPKAWHASRKSGQLPSAFIALSSVSHSACIGTAPTSAPMTRRVDLCSPCVFSHAATSSCALYFFLTIRSSSATPYF